MTLNCLTLFIFYDDTHSFPGGVKFKDVVKDIFAYSPVEADHHLVVSQAVVNVAIPEKFKVIC